MIQKMMYKLLVFLITFGNAECFLLPSNCKVGQYYDSGSMTCQYCHANASMVTSEDGFGCKCEEHSIPLGIASCKPCNATEIVSIDGTMCIPRRCQSSYGKVVCRRCPNDYISVTQNLDGSRLKEVQCVKCSRGYKAQGNVCVKCESCTCNKNQIIIRDVCISKSFINERPKYEENYLHPSELLNIVKLEYLCTRNYSRSCRGLADECVKNFYKADPAGPCRLWTPSKLKMPRDLPGLTIPTDDSINPLDLKSYGKNVIQLAVAIYTYNGGFKFLQDSDKRGKCQLPLEIIIGEDMAYDCTFNITELQKTDINGTLSPFLRINGGHKPLHVILQKPDGYHVQIEKWPSDKFRRYFMVHNFLSTTSNITQTVYLRTLLIRLRIERKKRGTGSELNIDIEAQFSIKDPASQTIFTSLRVENYVPSAEIINGLEIWSGALGVISLLYAFVQWRSTVRRGGPYISVMPLVCGATADVLFFAAWFTTLHALAAEAGTLGITLPLSSKENNLIKALVFSAFGLKVIKVFWTNWKQCQSDVFFIDWKEYNISLKDESSRNNYDIWRAKTLLREWSAIQSKRKVSPGFTVTLALLIFHIMSPWFSDIPTSPAYRWAIASIAWWSAYTVLFLVRWILDRFISSPSNQLPKICQGVGLSLLVFEEEYYAHYVHGRNDALDDVKSFFGTLNTCRILCAPQFRTAYSQLSVGKNNLSYNESRGTLLSKFLAAFFERSLEGMSWVASERTLLERLLDIELTSTESGFVSTLFYDNDRTPSCFVTIWWGQEWTLSTFDAMLFSFIVLTADDILLAAVITIVCWQVMTVTRNWFGDRNLTRKTNIQFD